MVSFPIDRLLQNSYDQFTKSFDEANSFAQISWQVSEATRDLERLPELTVPFQFETAHSKQIHDFVARNYRKYCWHFNLLFICATAEHYFHAANIVLEVTKTARDRKFTLGEFQAIQNKILNQKGKHSWYKFRDESRFSLEWSKFMDSIIELRNLIVHWHGQTSHCKSDSIFSWIHFQVMIGDQNIERLPCPSGEGGQLKISKIEKTVILKPGDSIELSLVDSLDINFTIFHAINEAHSKIIEQLKKKFPPTK